MNDIFSPFYIFDLPVSSGDADDMQQKPQTCKQSHSEMKTFFIAYALILCTGSLPNYECVMLIALFTVQKTHQMLMVVNA